MPHPQVAPASRPVVPPASWPAQDYYRRLPHWRRTNATYFVTWRVREGLRQLSPSERTLVVAALRHFDGERYALHAHVVMDDHVHVLVSPVRDRTLQSLTHSWKCFSANQMRKEGFRTGGVWQKESFDRVIRSETEFRQKLRYILENPFKRWPELTEYPWVGMAGQEAGGTTGREAGATGPTARLSSSCPGTDRAAAR